MNINFGLRKQVMDKCNKLLQLKQLSCMNKYYFKKLEYENIIQHELFELNNMLIKVERYLYQCHKANTRVKDVDNKPVISKQKEFTLEQLSEYNGSTGRPAYIAVNGVVYDVSNEPSWGGGTHNGLVAGNDLTQEFNSCHGGSNILTKLSVVGVLKR